MIRLFTGFDQREAIGWHAFAQSVMDSAMLPVAITPITARMQKDGTNAFTYSRFLVPWLCDFAGWALFADGADMICKDDISKLWLLADSTKAVQVVKHDYKTKFPRKYLGTDMEAPNVDYPRKNWSSLILWNCGHPRHRILGQKFIADAPGAYLHRFEWLANEDIGTLPIEWNWLVDEYGENEEAKLLHWTAGIPAIAAHSQAPQAEHWFASSFRTAQAPQPPRYYPRDFIKAAA